MDFCKCGSIKTTGICSNRRCPEKDSKQRVWIINGVQVKFKQPVTFQEAIETTEETVARIREEVALKRQDADVWDLKDQGAKRAERIRRKRG